MLNTHWVSEWTIKHIEAAFQAEDNLLDLSKGWEAEESCLPRAPVTARYPFRRRFNSSRSNGSEMVKLEPSFSYPQQNISYKSVDRNYLTDLSPHWFQVSIRSLHYRLWTVPWPVQCLLVGSISPSAIVTEMPNICQTLSREIVLSGWGSVCPRIWLLTVSEEGFLHRSSFLLFIPRIELLFLPLVASLHRCLRAELGPSTKLPRWLQISLRIWWGFKIPRYFAEK